MKPQSLFCVDVVVVDVVVVVLIVVVATVATAVQNPTTDGTIGTEPIFCMRISKECGNEVTFDGAGGGGEGGSAQVEFMVIKDGTGVLQKTP